MRRTYLEMVEHALNIGIEMNKEGKYAADGDFSCTEEEYRVLCMAPLAEITIERSQLTGAPDRFCGLKVVRAAHNTPAK